MSLGGGIECPPIWGRKSEAGKHESLSLSNDCPDKTGTLERL